MTRKFDLLLTALAPVIWGRTYLITTQWLPQGYPLTVSLLRGLPAGLLLLLLVRQLPHGRWWAKVFVLGALNFSIFWWFLFISAYRLPGGIAATIGAIQPLIVIFLSHLLLKSPLRPLAIIAAVSGLAGVGLLTVSHPSALDPVGMLAGLGGAISMACGVVLTRKWLPPVPLLTFTAWQLTAGGLLLMPVALWFEPTFPSLTGPNILGLIYLSLIGGAFTYFLWFRGIARLEPAVVSALGFLSPVSAVVLGWWVLGQNLTPVQVFAVFVVLGAVLLSQKVSRR